MKILYNLGGISHAHNALRVDHRSCKQKSYTSSKKTRTVQAVDRLVEEENLHQNVAAGRLGMDPCNIRRWHQNKTALSGSSVENKLSLHKGPSSIIDDIKDDLIAFIVHWREKGFPLTRMGLVRKVGRMKPEFNEKTLQARKMAISRFLARNHLTHRVATHKAQREPGEVRGEALAHLEVQVPRVNDTCRHQDFIMNMDQTPVYHSMGQEVTIDFVGARTVNLRSSANDSQRVTVAVTITASGKRLTSMVVFKGE
jgi:DNA-binding transcriptional regulator YiaG